MDWSWKTPQARKVSALVNGRYRCVYICIEQLKFNGSIVWIIVDALSAINHGWQIILAGFKFWKIGSRKLFAVKEEDIVKKKGKGKGRKMPVLSDYEDDDYDDSSAFSPAAAKKQKNDCGSVELESIMEDVKSIHRDLQSVLKLTPNSKVPLGLKQVLLDTFRCNICIATPMVPPIIYTRCCKRILGCQSCVDTWYSGEEGMRKKCPICRSERAYADTTQLKGLDDFLLTIAPILNQGGTNTEDEPEVDMAE